MKRRILGPRLIIVLLGVSLGILARLLFPPPEVVSPNGRAFDTPDPATDLNLPATSIEEEILDLPLLNR